MKISAFTFVRDANLFDFQIEESIRSVLPIVDEFIINVGKSNDNTLEIIQNINSDKIRIIESVWDTSKYNTGGQIYAYLTDLMFKECTGDWCLYIQGDEVLHEDALPEITAACETYLYKKEVDGFLLRYVHMYADYNHYIPARHLAYPKEIRIVRNDKEIHSWRDAQSFRRIPNFDYEDYYQTENTELLRCILLNNAFMFHYGWSRDPYKMVKKISTQKSLYETLSEKDRKKAEQPCHDYGNISVFPVYKGTQPKVMEERIKRMDWKDRLSYEGKNPELHKIFPLKYRIINCIEKFLPNGNRIGGFSNYKQKGIFTVKK